MRPEIAGMVQPAQVAELVDDDIIQHGAKSISSPAPSVQMSAALPPLPDLKDLNLSIFG